MLRARVVEAVAELRRGACMHALRRKRLITYASTHATFDTARRRGLRGVAATAIALERWNPRTRRPRARWRRCCSRRSAPTTCPSRCCSTRCYDETRSVRRRVDAALSAVAHRHRVRQSIQEHLDEFQLAKPTIVAATGSSLPDTGHSSRAHGDLRTGGHELADEIRAGPRRDRARTGVRSRR